MVKSDLKTSLGQHLLHDVKASDINCNEHARIFEGNPHVLPDINIKYALSMFQCWLKLSSSMIIVHDAYTASELL